MCRKKKQNKSQIKIIKITWQKAKINTKVLKPTKKFYS